MSWPASILIALFAGVLGLFVGGWIAALCVGWYRISSFEGKSGFFIVGIALLAGVASCIVSLLACRLLAAGVLQGIAWSVGLILLAGGLSVLLCYCQADIPPKLQGQCLMLEIEWRLPSGSPEPLPSDALESSFTLGSTLRHVQRASRKGEIHWQNVRQADGRWILPCSVELFTQRGLRTITLDLSGASCGGFVVPLPARPGNPFTVWSDWGPRPPHKPWPDTESSFRFRVQPIHPEAA